MTSNLLRPLQRQFAHLLWLPGFAIVTILLTMTDRRAEMHAIDGANGEQRNFKIKFNHAFHNHATRASASALLSILPCLRELFGRADKALAFAGRAHDRFDDARKTHCGYRIMKTGLTVGKAIRRCRQS
ncbi:Uncharacterised protein [Salmonella enterica subsp. enterica serovar Bovismorbificans]|uniref:Uncharacterized protein n=1 Tax=Salmonella enterica subsp. enterica serovar Bovismorbificans TaxID=58097 RepID=A0A655ED46_SALET|nr:Uncharacterised protein [Salmonella enterica subsp. enterica serovar Bovismorbificans]CNV15483.1 Uncharacterised protein [Salmonella enterica subsp. enterica serovar Bovismorbificans]